MKIEALIGVLEDSLGPVKRPDWSEQDILETGVRALDDESWSEWTIWPKGDHFYIEILMRHESSLPIRVSAEFGKDWFEQNDPSSFEDECIRRVRNFERSLKPLIAVASRRVNVAWTHSGAVHLIRRGGGVWEEPKRVISSTELSCFSQVTLESTDSSWRTSIHTDEGLRIWEFSADDPNEAVYALGHELVKRLEEDLDRISA